MGVDLGGTNIAAGIVSDRGEIVLKSTVKTPEVASPEKIALVIAELCFEIIRGAGLCAEDISAVGVCVPGSVLPEEGIVEVCVNLGFRNVPFGHLLEARLGKAVKLVNDANAAALAEYAAGAGRGCQSLVMLTLGTGIGGGIVINNRIYSGVNHAAGEMGHIVIHQGGEECKCGRRGCFEAYASATALKRLTRDKMKENPDSVMWSLAGSLDSVGGGTAFEAAARNDKAAMQVISQYTAYLASGITSIVNIFQPEVLCIGGGLSGEGETLLSPVREILDREDFARNSKKRTRLVTAMLGNDAGIIGAAMLPLYDI